MSNRTILLLNAIIELFGGMVLIMYPEFLVSGGHMDNLELNISKMYGIGAACIGLLSYVLFRYCENALLIKYSSLTIITFHLILSFHLYGMYRAAILKEPHAMITHLVITGIFTIIYLKNIK